MITLIRAISMELDRLRNCGTNQIVSELARHNLNVLQEMLPSGSGIDSGAKIEIDVCKRDKIFLSCDFHHMNENGYYTQWTYHTITVTPAFTGFNIVVSGQDHNDIKDYLTEVYYAELQTPIERDTNGEYVRRFV